MEGWRQWRLGGRKNLVQRKNERTDLTPTGLLMEGVYTQNPVVSEIEIFQQLRSLMRDGDMIISGRSCNAKTCLRNS
jgi:hypothetical protein